MGERGWVGVRIRELGSDAERLRPEPWQDDTLMEHRQPMSEPAGEGATNVKKCIYPGCERPAVPPHPLGGPQPSFCDLEEHNALTAHQERQRLARGSQQRENNGQEVQ